LEFKSTQGNWAWRIREYGAVSCWSHLFRLKYVLYDRSRIEERDVNFSEKSTAFRLCSAADLDVGLLRRRREASEYEIEYRATLNEGGPPLASFQDSAPFAAGTPLTITANFDSSTADQWNVGAYFYTAPSATFPHRVIDIRGGGSVGDPAERPIVAIGRRAIPL
jgi:hypothetical protein